MTHKELVAIIVSAVLANVYAHGSMIWPPQRGITNGFKFAKVRSHDPGAQSDWFAHFPAGDKSTAPGAATRSQRQAAGPAGWTPYNPFDPHFKWRANVCGDLNWKYDHMRGGKYYNGGKIHATYTQGSAISVDMAIVAHHNGYIEMYVCDVAKCGGEISKKCFQQGSCHKLRRTWEQSCESRNDWKCAPIDPKHPSRWYLPCGKSGTPGNGVDIFGHGKIKFQLPSDLVCEHCVVQWYWVGANDCNPPGLTEYFKSDRHPFWGDCPGQGEARGGWRRWENPCGGHRFPEEYYTCADIRINSKWQSNNWDNSSGARSARNRAGKQKRSNKKGLKQLDNSQNSRSHQPKKPFNGNNNIKKKINGKNKRKRNPKQRRNNKNKVKEQKSNRNERKHMKNKRRSNNNRNRQKSKSNLSRKKQQTRTRWSSQQPQRWNDWRNIQR